MLVLLKNLYILVVDGYC